jgi:molybdopterin biosynthesis enzyme MoaB
MLIRPLAMRTFFQCSRVLHTWLFAVLSGDDQTVARRALDTSPEAGLIIGLGGPALAGHGPEAIRDAITRTITGLLKQLRQSLSWYQGVKMTQHA